jgi:hypothetical protein
MRNILINSMLSLTVALSAMSFAPAASAQGLELELGRDGSRLRLLEECDSRYEDCRDRREIRRDDRWREDERLSRRRCTEERALDKAERIGLRRARVVSVGRRVIEVRGRDRYGDRVTVEFGRAPNCPVL